MLTSFLFIFLYTLISKGKYIKEIEKKNIFFLAYQNHAHEDIIRQNLNKFDAIVVVSGDGLIHEVSM